MNTTFNKKRNGQTMPDINVNLGNNCIGQVILTRLN